MSTRESQMTERLGPILFGAGVLVAIASGAKMPEGSTSWPDSVPVFVVASIVAALGIFMWRRTIARFREQSADAEGGQSGSPQALLDDLMGPLATFVDEIQGLDADTICNRVDELLERYVLPFARSRQQVLDRFGMDRGAEILVVVAYGERMLNRTWSAAGDGHLPEARASLPESAEAFREAHSLFQEGSEPAVD